MNTWKTWLTRFGLWLAQHGGWDAASLVHPYARQIESLLAEAEHASSVIKDLQVRMATAATVTKPVFDRAGELAQAADTTMIGGEAKRHQVYARLIKDFPTTSKRELALAIELALFHAPKEG